MVFQIVRHSRNLARNWQQLNRRWLVSPLVARGLVTIERAFSSLKLILSDNRSRLSEDTLENILLVKLNAEFLDNTIDGRPTII